MFDFKGLPGVVALERFGRDQMFTTLVFGGGEAGSRSGDAGRFLWDNFLSPG